MVINGQDLLNGYWSGDVQVLTLFQAWWYVALAVLLVVMVLTWNIKRSRLGRAMMAVRDRDLAAGVVGIPVTRTKVVAFAISSAFAGLSGALLTAYMGYFTPGQWSLMLSVDFIAMVVIGGLGTISGAILGAFFFKAMPEVINWLAQYIPFISQDAKVDGGVTAPLLSQFLYGLVIVLVLIFEPRGLYALLRKPVDALRARRRGRCPMSDLALAVTGLSVRYGAAATALSDVTLDGAARGDRRPARPQRRRQDHPDARGLGAALRARRLPRRRLGRGPRCSTSPATGRLPASGAGSRRRSRAGRSSPT